MSFKVKLISVSILVLMLTVGLAGFFGYRESKWKIKDLAKELLETRTEQAFAICDRHYKNSLEPSEELKNEIAHINIAKDGYIAVLRNEEPLKGVLLIHPSDVGKSIYTDEFPHIKAMLDSIEAHDNEHGYSNYIYYHQQTTAKGLQGERKIGYYKYFAPWDWVILATGYEKDVFASRDALRTTLIRVFVLVILVGILLVNFIIRQMFKPIQRLTDTTKEVTKGNWDVYIEHRSKDEIGMLADAFNNMVRSLKENARMWHEFNVARDMQAQMLPKTYPRIAGVQISAKSVPTKEVGGDFYDFIDFENGRLGLVVGDVSGHGVSAAMVMTAAMGAVRFAAEVKRGTDEVLNLVNTRLNKDIQNNMFVALFYGIFDSKNRKFYYTNAGQTMPFLWRDGNVTFLPQADNSDRFPLGIVRSAVYEQLRLNLQTGDLLVFYTDGIVDAMDGFYETFGFDRLSDAIIRHAGLPPDDMIENLVKDMRDYSKAKDFQDDITLVIVKVT